ncbi:ATP-binding protein [Bacillus sp. WLY-B-L8]|uniref:ATP-binding protein n=1 Tax=Bacillus multifaciens TaxID=3068506 RepID=UPI0027403666|nr:ATP-binding protein [Bacillus sp. WLY-B-L8]MDP7977665.1 ATP-binding protein [Bacillus sp. WLY-B-L8]
METTILNLTTENKVGKIISVDTSNIIVNVDNPEIMTKLSIGHIMAVKGNFEHELLICLIEKVTRSQLEMIVMDEIEEEDMETSTNDLIRATLIGTFKSVDGTKRNVFKRGVNLFPNVDGECYLVNGDNLQRFMNILDKEVEQSQKLIVGNFANDTNSLAILDGDKLFQRHASILGSTGSGKSWCVATILEKASELKYPNIIVFDMHGEYSSLTRKESKIAEGFKIAGAGDLDSEDPNLIYLPFWLLNREEILSTILDRSDSNAPNQSSRFTAHLKTLKLASIEKEDDENVKKSFTVDSPIPYSIIELIALLKEDDIGMKLGANNREVKGDWNGKLTRFISRLETKVEDKRYAFLYNPKEECNTYDWLNTFISKLLCMNKDSKGIKIIDFSEVPSDILPIVTGTLARILYDVQFWMKNNKRTPFTLLCDEAHLYLPVKDDADSVQKQALYNFERIAKEGRKYGVSLFVVSQRPSDVSRTILSQCNNFIVLRLTNDRDQGVVKNLVPDSLKGVTDCLPILDVGEALILGDAILLPNRIKLHEPKLKPESNTVDFWKKWNEVEPEQRELVKAIRNMRAQSRIDD